VPPGTTNVWIPPVEAKAVWNVSAYMASDALLEAKWVSPLNWAVIG